MKILIIHTVLWSHYKARVYSELYRQSQELDDAISLKVVHIAATERSRAKLGKPDLSLHQYPYEVLHDGFLEDFPFQARLKALIKVIHDFRPDVINTPGYYDPVVVLATMYCRMRGIRIVISNDSTSDDHQRIGWKETLKRQIIGMADGFFCYGTLSAAYMLELGARPEQILLKRNAVDNDAVRQLFQQSLPGRAERLAQEGLPARNFIYVGRIIDRLKNLRTLIQSFGAVQQDVPADNPWGLIILGQGDDQPALEDLIRQENIPYVRFLGGKSWDKVPAYLALADVLVLPSYSEPWGLVVNEAMACGLPVLVSDRCGCAPDLVENGRNGFTFAPDQPAQLTEALRQLVKQPDLARQMGEQSAAMIEPYSLQHVAAQMLQGFLLVTNYQPASFIPQ
ncbi:glycosyltransferase family 4 protein [Tellurirhabdus rosea]|uniref:glycosyltransferase family 4 protein n=1 Tax=Tellurirhabdus rosea TaxID=2674997 RepID=UPI00224E8372|nr:glycosyltransferase family 4 protein [Tellurirhabdus rosea]